jgi:hypothetical protein
VSPPSATWVPPSVSVITTVGVSLSAISAVTRSIFIAVVYAAPSPVVIVCAMLSKT